MQAQQVLQATNPLGLVDLNKRLEIFESAGACYTRLFKWLYFKCPRGYVDIPYHMALLQGLRICEATPLCKRKVCALVPWDNKKARDNMLRILVCIMLRVTGCTFSENAFQCAVYELEITIRNENERRQKENG